MSTLRRFTTEDLFNFGNINLDHLTETVKREMVRMFVSSSTQVI